MNNKEISIFSWSLLDAIINVFGAILMVYVFIATQAHAAGVAFLENHYAALAVEVVGLDAAGKPLPDTTVCCRLDVIMPPLDEQIEDATLDKLPGGWEHFRLPLDESGLRT